jgi:hypothetical protein
MNFYLLRYSRGGQSPPRAIEPDDDDYDDDDDDDDDDDEIPAVSCV